MNDAAPPQVKSLPTVVDNGEFSMLMDTSKFGQLQRVGTMYAHSKMVPAHFQGDEASCMVAVQMAMRLNIDPFMFLQKTYVVSGKPGMEAPLVIALINARGPFTGPIGWNVTRNDKGDVMSCTAFATHKATGRVCSAEVTWAMVEAEGWSKKNGSKWNTLRELMFKYRSAAFLGRLYCPEVLMGMSMAEELQDAEIDITPARSAPPPAESPATSLKGRLGIKAAEVVIEQEVPSTETTIATTTTTPEAVKADLAEGRATQTGPTSGNPPPKPFGAPREPQAAPEPQDATDPLKSAGAPPEGAAVMSFDELLKYAKKAKTKDQADIVTDQARHPSYTDDQRKDVRIILESKKFED